METSWGGCCEVILYAIYNKKRKEKKHVQIISYALFRCEFLHDGEELRGLNFSHVTAKKKKWNQVFEARKTYYNKYIKEKISNRQEINIICQKTSVENLFLCCKFGYVYLICNYSFL